MSACRICGNLEGNRAHVGRERMFGLGEEFVYDECARCGCLQIREVPEDLGRYYPDDYYSKSEPRHPHRPDWILKVRRRKLRHLLGEGDRLGAVLAAISGPERIPPWMKGVPVRHDDRILDVGCGSGEMLLSLARRGFTRLEGVDPFIDGDLAWPIGGRVKHGERSDLEGPYDLVMMHHSFEHMAEPLEVLRQARRILSDGGRVIARIPVATAWAWREYGEHWVALDAPRHLFLHTEDSMRRLAVASGFRIERVVYDSTSFQFWGSEQYRLGIPLMDARSHHVDPKRSPFGKAQIAEWERRAEELNRRGEGDTAAFYLVPDGKQGILK